MNSLSFEDVSFSYDSYPVINKINLNIFSPGITHICGNNGSGKTTLLKLAAGVLVPLAGKVTSNYTNAIYINNENLLYPELTVKENINFYSTISGHPIKSDSLLKWGLDKTLYSRTRSLSSGQKMRVRLAIAFGIETDVLALDEPFSTLDPHGHNLLDTELIQYADTRLILLTSHQELSQNIPIIKKVQL